MKIACEPLAPESDDYRYILQSTKLTFDESATTMNKAVHCVDYRTRAISRHGMLVNVS